MHTDIHCRLPAHPVPPGDKGPMPEKGPTRPPPTRKGPVREPPKKKAPVEDPTDKGEPKRRPPPGEERPPVKEPPPKERDKWRRFTEGSPQDLWRGLPLGGQGGGGPK